jgi:uncharacterized protein with WD repeat
MATPTQGKTHQLLREIIGDIMNNNAVAHAQIELHLLAAYTLVQEGKLSKVQDQCKQARSAFDYHTEKLAAKLNTAMATTSALQKKMADTCREKCKADLKIKELEKKLRELETEVDDRNLSNLVEAEEKKITEVEEKKLTVEEKKLTAVENEVEGPKDQKNEVNEEQISFDVAMNIVDEVKK